MPHIFQGHYAQPGDREDQLALTENAELLLPWGVGKWRVACKATSDGIEIPDLLGTDVKAPALVYTGAEVARAGWNEPVVADPPDTGAQPFLPGSSADPTVVKTSALTRTNGGFTHKLASVVSDLSTMDIALVFTKPEADVSAGVPYFAMSYRITGFVEGGSKPAWSNWTPGAISEAANLTDAGKFVLVTWEIALSSANAGQTVEVRLMRDPMNEADTYDGQATVDVVAVNVTAGG